MWKFTREVLMSKDSWKKTEGNLSPRYSSPRNVPLSRRTRVASSETGGQPLISVSSPVAVTPPPPPPPPKYLCFVGSVVCPVVLQKHSAGFRIARIRHIPQVTSSRVVPFVSRGRCPGASSSEHGTTSDALSSTVALHLSAAKRTRNGPMLN